MWNLHKRQVFLVWCLAAYTTTTNAWTLRPSTTATRNGSTCRTASNLNSMFITSPFLTGGRRRRGNQMQLSGASPGSSSSSMDDFLSNPPKNWQFVGFRRSPTAASSSSRRHQSSYSFNDVENSAFDDDSYLGGDYYGYETGTDGVLMPDGGLSPCVIKVIGVGGGGCNAVDRMLDTAVGGVDFWAINTDAQALGRSRAKGAKVLNIGTSVTRGLGAGGNPDIGRAAAEESVKDIAQMVAGTDLCFVTSGMGGGTGSGAAPVVAEVAKEQGCLTVGIVTKPFMFEGKRRMKQAIAAIERLRHNVDTVIVVSNDRLLEIIPDDTPMERAFAVADDILRQGVVGISDIIVKPGLINVDFADVRSIMSGAGTALMGIGIGQGKSAAEDAATAAISSPLLDSTIENAKGVVFNISGGSSLSLSEVNQAAKRIYSTVEADANVIFGALVDETLEDNISITVLATGFKTPESEITKQIAQEQKLQQQAEQRRQADNSRLFSTANRKSATASSASVANTKANTGAADPSSLDRAGITGRNTRNTRGPSPPPSRRSGSSRPPLNKKPTTRPTDGDDDDSLPPFLKNLKKRR